MNEEQKQKVFELCKRAKRGRYVSEEELAFLDRMCHEHREEYIDTQRAASEEAVKDYVGLWESAE